MNDTLIQYANLTGISCLSSIPYSKEETGIVDRSNKEVSRQIRYILFDNEEWSSYLQMTEKLFDSSIKQPAGTSNQNIHDPYGIMWKNSCTNRVASTPIAEDLKVSKN